MSESYQPVNCSFYDQLEALAVLKKAILLKYKEREEVCSIQTKIKTLETLKKEEFLITEQDQKIRLDKIITYEVVGK